MIVKVSKNDVPNINKLGKLIYENFEKTYIIENYLLNDNYNILASKNEEIEGFVIFYKNIDYYELQLIVIKEDKRNKGIASSLIDFFIKKYCKTGDEILLEVSKENKLALKLYEKFGFTTISIRKKYYGNVDAYVMKKVI